MSDLSSELNLALAVDDDDTADYLTTNSGLRGNLVTIDGLFSSSTGHNHNGAHQGGALQFINLSIGGNLTVNGSSEFKAAVVCDTTLHVIGAATFDSSLSAASLSVSGTTQLTGAVTTGGNLSIGQDGWVGRDLQVVRNFAVSGTSNLGPSTASSLNVTGALSASGTFACNNPTINGSISGGPSFVTGPLSADWFRNTGINTGIFNTPANQGIAFNASGAYLYPANDQIVGVAGVQTLQNKIYVNARISGPVGIGVGANDLTNYMINWGTGTFTLPNASAAYGGVFRAVKAFGGPATVNCGTALYGPGVSTNGAFNLQNGDSVTCWCDGSNWWVL